MALTMRDLVPLLMPAAPRPQRADIAGTIMQGKGLEERQRANRAHEAFLRDDLAEKKRASQAVQQRELARIAEARRASMAADARAREKAQREQATEQAEAVAKLREMAAAGAPQEALRAMAAELGLLGVDMGEAKTTGPLPDAGATELREPMAQQQRPIAAFDMPALQMQSPGPLEGAPEPGTGMGQYQLEAGGRPLGQVDAAGIQQEQRESLLPVLHGIAARSRPRDRGARRMAEPVAMTPPLAADPQKAVDTFEDISGSQLDREAADRRAAMSAASRRASGQRADARGDRMQVADAFKYYRESKNKDLDVPGLKQTYEGFQKVTSLLEEEPDNAAAVAGAVTQLSKSIGEDGRLTDADIARAMGVERDSVWGWIQQFHAEKTRGGVSDHVRDNILKAVEVAQSLTREKLRAAHDALQEQRSMWAPDGAMPNETAYNVIGSQIDTAFTGLDIGGAPEGYDGLSDDEAADRLIEGL